MQPHTGNFTRVSGTGPGLVLAQQPQIKHIYSMSTALFQGAALPPPHSWNSGCSHDLSQLSGLIIPNQPVPACCDAAFGGVRDHSPSPFHGHQQCACCSGQAWGTPGPCNPSAHRSSVLALAAPAAGTLPHGASVCDQAAEVNALSKPMRG